MGYSSKCSKHRWSWGHFAIIAALTSASLPVTVAQQASSQQLEAATVDGTVTDQAGKLVADASVLLEQEGSADIVRTKTNGKGKYAFAGLRAGSYSLSAEKFGQRSSAASVFALSQGDQKHLDLILEAQGAAPSNPSASSSAAEAMQFADQPNFTVAGVTDWTAVGGHGSDISLRTSEALTRETIALKPVSAGNSASASMDGENEATGSESQLRTALARAPDSFMANHELGEFYFLAGRYREAIPLLLSAHQIDSANHGTDYGNEYDLALAYKGDGDFSEARKHIEELLTHEDNADLHRLLGDLDERLDDPLSAVHEDERAVRLDPSEQNYFEWGSELLLHRAVWQAQEVFRQGAELYPKSARMLAGLGTSLFASGLYDEAAQRLCDASDLNPADSAPYIFLGKIEMAAPVPLPCVDQKLARFVQEQPGSALANYYYAMAMGKRQEHEANPPPNLHQIETLLTKAVTIDPKCGDGYLQLGILSFSQRNYEKAIDSYTKAIEVNPQLGEAHYRLAVAYDRIGEAAKARQEFQLHDEIEKQQADAIERQRREVKQFLVVLQRQPADSAPR